MASAKALESAKRIFKGKVRQDLIRETLPKAWNKIVLEPESLLAEFLAETTERLCGFKPDEAEAAEFIKQHRDRLKLTPSNPKVAQLPKGGNNDPPSSSRERSKQLECSIIPVIKLMKGDGKKHSEAFQLVAERRGINSQAVYSACTRVLQFSPQEQFHTQEFVEAVSNGAIIQRLKKKYPQQIELIDRELEPLYS